MSSDLSIQLAPVASPLVVIKGEVLAKIDDLVATAEVMTVVDVESAQTAATYKQQATRLGNEIETARTAAKAPAIAMGKAIDLAVKGPAERLDKAKRELSSKVANWQAEQDRIAREAEAARQREAARIAKEQREREEAARKANLPPPAPVPVTPVAVVMPKPKIEGVRMRTTLLFEVTDVAKLPGYLTARAADTAKIKAEFCQLWRDGDPIPEVPGIKFTIDRKAV